MFIRKTFGFIVSSVIIIAAIGGCSPKVGKSILSFFFDGVPALQNDSSAKMQESSEINSVSDTSLIADRQMKREFIYHYPYMEKECSGCHDEVSRSELIAKEPDLCYSCHESFSDKYKVVHGPVSGGYCTMCHNPHMSRNEHLLIRTGKQLCLHCHISDDVFENKAHSDIGANDCLQCHDPHGGKERFLMR